MKNAPVAVLGLLAAVGSAYTPTQHPRFRRGFNSLSPREEVQKPQEQATLTLDDIIKIMDKECPKAEKDIKTKPITKKCHDAAVSGLKQLKDMNSNDPNKSKLQGIAEQMTFNQQKFKPEPAKPEPAKPEPAKPEPAKPEPAKPEPAKPEPAKPEPAKPEPAKPEPAKPEPAKPEPAKPEPAKPEPAKPEPAKPEPAKPEPAKPEPAKPEPAKPEPVKPEPSKDEPVSTQAAKDFEEAKQNLTTCIQASQTDKTKNCDTQSRKFDDTCLAAKKEADKSQKSEADLKEDCNREKTAITSGDPDKITFPPVTDDERNNQNTKANTTDAEVVTALKACNENATTKACKEHAIDGLSRLTRLEVQGKEKTQVYKDLKDLEEKMKQLKGSTTTNVGKNPQDSIVQTADLRNAEEKFKTCLAATKEGESSNCNLEEETFDRRCEENAKKQGKKDDQITSMCHDAKKDIVKTSTPSSSTKDPNASEKSIRDLFDQLNQTDVALKTATGDDKKKLAKDKETFQADFNKACLDIKTTKRNSTEKKDEAKTKFASALNNPNVETFNVSNVASIQAEYFKFANMTIEESLCNHEFAKAEAIEEEVAKVQSGQKPEQKPDSTINPSGTAKAKQNDVTGTGTVQCEQNKVCKITFQMTVDSPNEMTPDESKKPAQDFVTGGVVPQGFKFTPTSIKVQEKEGEEPKEKCNKVCKVELIKGKMDPKTARIEPKADSASAGSVPSTQGNMANSTIQVNATKEGCECTIQVEFSGCQSNEPENKCTEEVKKYAANPTGARKFTVQRVQVTKKNGEVDATQSCGEGGKQCGTSNVPKGLKVLKVAVVKVDKPQQGSGQGVAPTNPGAITPSTNAPSDDTVTVKVSCCPENDADCTNPTINFYEIPREALKALKAAIEASNPKAREDAMKNLPPVKRILNENREPKCERDCGRQVVEAAGQKVREMKSENPPPTIDGSSGNLGPANGGQDSSQTTPTGCKSETVTVTVTETVTPTCGPSESSNRENKQINDQDRATLEEVNNVSPQENERPSGGRDNRDTKKVSNPDPDCPQDEQEDQKVTTGNKLETTTGGGEKIKNEQKLTEEKPKNTTQTSQDKPPNVNPPEDTPDGSVSSDKTVLTPPTPKRSRKNP